MIEIQNKQLTFNASKGTEVKTFIPDRVNGIEIKRYTERYEPKKDNTI